MGSLLSLFKSKKDTKTLLECIQNEIEDIEEFKYSTSNHEKNCICLLCSLFFIIYLISAMVLFFFFWVPITGWLVLTDLHFWTRISPFIVFPIIFYFLRISLRYYYQWVRDRKEERLRDLRKQKRKILDRVRETETYNTAEEILKKYDPKYLERERLVQQSTTMINTSPQRMTPINSQLRYRGNITPRGPLPAITAGPSWANTPQTSSTFRPQMPMGSVRGPVMTPARPPMIAPNFVGVRTVRPILPQNRSVVERVVDYMVGDGPNNRYALICIHCYNHNGMALKDEFDYIAYRCCYCHQFNPARKMRPQPPRLNSVDSRRSSSPLMPLIDEPESDTDSERGPKVTENQTQISEMTNQSDNEKVGGDQSESDIKKQTSDENQSTLDNESSNTLMSETGDETNVNDNEKDFKRETNNEVLEGKEIPFMDDSNDSSL